MLSEAKRLEKRKNDLRQIFLELTNQCNLNCAHCGSNCTRAKGEELSAEDWKGFITYIAERFDPRRILFCLTGGEPLLRKDFFEIASHIHKAGFRWGLTTNGTLIDAETAKALVACGLSSISISLDGLPKTHDHFRNCEGSFARAAEGIALLLKEAPRGVVQITTVAHRGNLRELPRLYELFLKWGVRDWRIASVDPIGRAAGQNALLPTAEEFQRIFEFITEKRAENIMNIQYGCAHFVPASFGYDLREMPYRCGAGEFIASVLHNGDIFSCLDIERCPELVQGNILKDDFLSAWLHGFSAFRGEVRMEKSEKCRNCKERDACRGDSAHTWDYHKNEPILCLDDLMRRSVYQEKKLCGGCGKPLAKNDSFCAYCGTERGAGSFEKFPFEKRFFQTLYGPPPTRYRFQCEGCGARWNRTLRSADGIRYCARCGSEKIIAERDEKELF